MKTKIDNKSQWSNGYHQGQEEALKSKYGWISVFDNGVLQYCAKVLKQKFNLMSVERIDFWDAMIVWGSDGIIDEEGIITENVFQIDTNEIETKQYIDQICCKKDFLNYLKEGDAGVSKVV